MTIFQSQTRLLLPNQQSHIQKYFVYCHERKRKAANPHLRGWNQQMFEIFARKMTEMINWFIHLSTNNSWSFDVTVVGG